ncbi:MAG: metallophosphoesterase [Nanoarchaeota archaeon]|nr:metallophosphoesterase [Nanoarchaeota archaeon]MBU1644072.1 metallophosphoesterase [Nanoarchaeota archaeon]MBU1977314.1 metallophosphoesterase [Nanoarchaeota archaeon]
MEISAGLEIVGLALWAKEQEILIINDLHLGYEEVLQRKGILIPKFQVKEILDRLDKIIKKTKPKIILINGDLKHEFATVLKQEWTDSLRLLDFLLKKGLEVIIIKGNHDPIIKPIAEKRNVKIVTEYLIGDVLIVHGDELPKTITTSIKTLIIGHEHPAITIREGSKWERYKCFLKGRWKNKTLIAVPSFNPLLEGTDILKEKLLSPFLDNLAEFKVFIVSKGEVFDFGKLKDLS